MNIIRSKKIVLRQASMCRWFTKFKTQHIQDFIQARKTSNNTEKYAIILATR